MKYLLEVQRWGCNMRNLTPIGLLVLFSLSGCLETEVKDETTTPEPPTTQLKIIPKFNDSNVAKAEVFFDANDNNVADANEYLGTTDVNGEFQSDRLNELYKTLPTATIMVQLKSDSSVILNEQGSYNVSDTRWLSLDLETLNVSSANGTETTAHVDAISTWLQALINNEGYTYLEALDVVNSTLKYADDVNPRYPDYDEYYYSSYLNGLEVGATSTYDYCCVSIPSAEFAKVGAKITWTYEEIFQRGDEPNLYEPPVFDYDPDGNLIISIPTKPSDPSNSENDGTYQANYPATGEFINSEGELPTAVLSAIDTSTGRINLDSDMDYAVVDGVLVMAFTNFDTGIPNLADLSVSFERNAIAFSNLLQFSNAGSTQSCDKDNYCHNVYQWPRAVQEIKSFDSWSSGEAILSVHGPTLGAYIYSNGGWGNWVDTSALEVWRECYTAAQEYHCDSYNSYFNYLDTVFDDVVYGPSGYYDYQAFGDITDDKLTFRNAIRVHENGSSTIGKQGDFNLITMPVNTINTFRPRGSGSGPLLGWFNERDDTLRGIAIKDINGWRAVGGSEYDQIHSMYSTAILEPKASSVTKKDGGYVVATAELSPVYDVDLNIEAYKFYIRKFDSDNEMWTQSWYDFGVAEQLKGFDVVVFQDGGVVAAACKSDGLLSLYRWTNKTSLPGFGIMEKHDTTETCSDVEFLATESAIDGNDSVVLVNSNKLYGISSDGGYIKLADNIMDTEELKWFRIRGGWVLTSNTKNVMLFAEK
ncbi:hypothetical protein [Vibrio harveyi]|uniref:hypothetical protein n=1 Tax=Vibrio harveyi TaxID=669 RepID=UPI003BB65B4B|nr:hypothetical protein [Vibrio harveyi]